MIPSTNPPTLATILRRDLPASLAVFWIAVPLSLGIALASDAPVVAGLIAAAVGGVVAGAIGGAPLQITGPAAGLTVAVSLLVARFGWPVACAATIVAGAIQALLGGLRIARGALVIAPSVVHGMLAGIGVVIALAQLHEILGGQPDTIALHNLRDLPGQLVHPGGAATLIGLGTVALLFLWRLVPKRLRVVPGPLIAVTVMTALSAALHLDIPRLALPRSLFAERIVPALPGNDLWGPFLVAALGVALIASVESLLSASAIDKRHDGPRADLDRELIGQGAANIVSGLLGGLPVAGVIVRSTANVQAGATSRLSAILQGLWILPFVAVLGPFVELIPRAVLAGLLVQVGISLVNLQTWRDLREHRETPIYLVTVAGVVLLGLLPGVGLGIAVSIALTLRRLANARITVDERDSRQLVRIEGALTFASVPQLTRTLTRIPPGADVTIHLSTDFLDHAAFEALHSWRLAHERTGGRVEIDESHENWYESAASGSPRTERSTPLAAVSAILFGRRRAPDTKSSTLLEGIEEFQRSGAPTVRPVFESLASGQSPETLFITCCDSRVVPTLFTASGPGDLFKVRNIGNIIPVHKSEPAADDSVGAALEYAIDVLKVPTVVVCGHSACGAMRALLNQDVPPDWTHLNAWLAHGEASLTRYKAGDPAGQLPGRETSTSAEADASGADAVDTLARVNVVQQLANLRTYPAVARAEGEKRIRIMGLFFDIEQAKVLLYDETQRQFHEVGALQ